MSTDKQEKALAKQARRKQRVEDTRRIFNHVAENGRRFTFANKTHSEVLKGRKK